MKGKFDVRNNEKEIEENVINSYLIEEDLVKLKPKIMKFLKLIFHPSPKFK